MPVRNWFRQRGVRVQHEAELAAFLASTPPPPAKASAPWSKYQPDPDEKVDNSTFYGPDPDSEDGIESARILNQRIEAVLRDNARRAAEQHRITAQGDAGRQTLTNSEERIFSLLDEQRRALHRDAAEEPPRMYVVQRRHIKSGLSELQTMDGDWTTELDLYTVKIGHAKRLAVPEDDEVYNYWLEPFDALLYEAKRAQDDEMLQRALVDLPA